MADSRHELLRVSGAWTHRDRQQHHLVVFEVPAETTQLTIRFRWSPIQVGSRHERNLVTLSLFGPRGFRGAAVRARKAQVLSIGETSATPGFLPGALLPGTWQISLDTFEILNRGGETGTLEYELSVHARIGRPTPEPSAQASATAVARHPEANGGGRWLRGDLHSHTVHSDGSITVEDRARGAVERRLDFLAISDHNTISQNSAADPWPDELIRIRGCEVTTYHGHMQVLGLADWIDWRDSGRGRGAASILDQAARQGAIASINHPAAFGNPWCAGCHWDFARVDYARLEAIEVWNGRWPEPETDNNGALAFWTDLLDAGLRPTAISGTDSHSAEEDQYHALPMNHVFAAEPTEAGILDGIRRGHVVLSSGPGLRFTARTAEGFETGLPGSEMPAGRPFRLSVAVSGVVQPATLWYVTSGSARLLGAIEFGDSAFECDALEAVGWWRLEVRNATAPGGDVLALTNPVYMVGGEG